MIEDIFLQKQVDNEKLEDIWGKLMDLEEECIFQEFSEKLMIAKSLHQNRIKTKKQTDWRENTKRLENGLKLHNKTYQTKKAPNWTK